MLFNINHFKYLPMFRYSLYLYQPMYFKYFTNTYQIAMIIHIKKTGGSHMAEIILENVSKSFNTNNGSFEALKNVNLSINKGDIYGIIGLSGAGKSTLVRCINLLEKPTTGKVYVNDTELTALSPRELRKCRERIGMIFQHFNLFTARTVYENVAFPLRKSRLSNSEKKAKVEDLLKLVELEDKADVYPSNLSGGQKQRAAIARALAGDPEILLSDESTSALDPKTTKAILNLLKKINKEFGITIVVITHEMQVIKDICDRVAVMKNGVVVETGKVFDIFANPKEAVTKEFVENTANLSKIYELIDSDAEITRLKPGQVILRSSYLERDVSEALVSQISRKFELDVNIIFGNVELIGGSPIGGLVSIVQGEPEMIENAITYLRDKNVGVEVILDGRYTK